VSVSDVLCNSEKKVTKHFLNRALFFERNESFAVAFIRRRAYGDEKDSRKRKKPGVEWWGEQLNSHRQTTTDTTTAQLKRARKKVAPSKKPQSPLF
jgi:hypothetical protein